MNRSKNFFMAIVIITCLCFIALPQAMAAVASHGTHLIECADFRQIPLENLIAAHAGAPGSLLAITEDPDELGALIGSLETGVEGVVLRTTDSAAPTRLMAELQSLLAEIPPPESASEDAGKRSS